MGIFDVTCCVFVVACCVWAVEAVFCVAVVNRRVETGDVTYCVFVVTWCAGFDDDTESNGVIEW